MLRSMFTRILSTLLLFAGSAAAAGTATGADERPNIVWITTEDHGPHLGAYGDPHAHTPHIDALAESSLRYDVAWSNAPVCAPARTTLLTGMYPPSTGGQHMRTDVRLPGFIRFYPQLLRDAGYYATNRHKEDYNVSGDPDIWDESSRQAHYRNRPEGKPFFAVFNLHESHEARIRDRTALPHHDPDTIPVPPYHPDTPEVRRDWAQYYHSVTRVDEQVGNLLAELEADGLADNTIVWFYADHGSGMPRHKRWPYNSGLHVPLLIHFPEKWRHLAPDDHAPGGHTRRLVSFVDFAPSLLSTAGIEPPGWMQGKAFLGPDAREPRRVVFGFRGRMDEVHDLVRSVRNDRYVYIRNYYPHLIQGQYLGTMFRTRTTQVWRDLHEQGALTGPQAAFWEPKPVEELYDLERDPHEVVNLADSAAHQQILTAMRALLRNHLLATRDSGFLPEAEKHRRAGDDTVYEMLRDNRRYPIETILAAAERASRAEPDQLPRLLEDLDDGDPAIRYWGLTGIDALGGEAFDETAEKVRERLNDENPSAAVAAASLLVKHGTGEDRRAAVERLLELAPPDRNGPFAALAAMTVIADLPPEILRELRPFLEEMPVIDPNTPDRPNDYVRRRVATALERAGAGS